ncbi:myotubularin-related protein 10-B isoform X2 [Phlebotomus argentipes]|uniref:myotubularin-related protein 10-B isoform X2 n=1 Tax=Phlebotomus argentipes TaxID=94469 RepID=UPI002892DA8F|nr:myotubularin-related protein 10-B isoform X2 [Phlebotomus argentipes]
MNHIGTKEKNNFTSYLAEYQTDQDSGGDADASLKPKLLHGELEVARATQVVLHPPVTNKNDSSAGKMGLLVVTNFKLSFISVEDSQSANFVYQENIFLGKNDVTLSNIDLIYQVVDKKKKIVSPQVKISSKIDYLLVICKNFRMLRFGFKESKAGSGKHIADALLRFAFPTQHNLIFSYRYKEKYYNTIRNVAMFNKKSDWVSELHRCGASTKDWRVLYIDGQQKLPDGSMPASYVIPKDITDEDYFQAAETFCDKRNAVWVYQYERASLIRMAELRDKTNSRVENLVFERVRACHPTKRQPHIMDLTKPTLEAIGSSYRKLRQLCTPDSPKSFSDQDDKFLKHLEASSWLLHVSHCLSYAQEVAERMKNGETVILQENEGRDMCCVISSLTQIILDAYVRTINGFQSLVQKEWVALGHPFSTRLGHVNSADTEDCPLFLLFLDCTWQLLQQYPQDFEFTETYLTTLWDAAFMPLFDTFQFNSERERLVARNEGLILRSVWDWGEQFADKDIVYFSNPCYRRPVVEPSRRSVVLPASAVPLPIIGAPDYHPVQPLTGGACSRASIMPVDSADTRIILSPQCSVKWLDIWVQCYYRWLPIVEIPNGGTPQVELFHRVILSNVSKLQQALQTRDFDELPQHQNGTERTGPNLPAVNSFFPFSRTKSDSTELTEILIASNHALVDGSIFDAISQAHIE